ncbi:hypothetical protein GPALN_014451 [Globodera pallida]|nr:hypothetical protein GPALN_014451 [Globodera pallida]
MLLLSDVYQLRQQLSNCALPFSADFGIFARHLKASMASLDDGGQQSDQQHQTTDAQPFPIADTPLRRSLLATFWRFVQLDWIWRRLRIRTFASADLVAVHSEQRRRHSSPISAADDRTPMRQNSVVYFALGLTLIGFQENIEGNSIILFIDNVVMRLGTLVNFSLAHFATDKLARISFGRMPEQDGFKGCLRNVRLSPFPSGCQSSNVCATNPCLNGGTCEDQWNAMRCQCARGFAGGNCELNQDECGTRALRKK